MKKKELQEKVAAVKGDICEVLETVFDQLNSGQQKKLLKNEKVRALFDRYGVKYSG